MPSLPGFLVTIHALDGAHIPPVLLGLYHYAWFVGFGLSFAPDLVLPKLAPNA